MRGITVEFHCVAGAGTARAGIADVLEQEDVKVAQAGSVHAGVPVLLSFDHVDEEVCAAVREQSRQGAQRVVALALNRENLDTRGTWQLMEAGATDVLAWDSDRRSTAALVARLRRYCEIDELLESPLVRDQLVGCSRAWIRTLRQLVEVARFTDASVLLTGESGTGKELVARLIHALDARPTKRDLVVLDCTTISPELAGSEFFGHERGAFTHAFQARDGAFALADEGVLFLDEVGELPLGMQAELLRVIQERSYKRVGSNIWKQVNFRLICATNRNLQEEQALGHFRGDFYHRIASWTCHLPPLRERREDIPLLAEHFLREFYPDGPVPEFDPAIQGYLLTRDYPGNIRELRQLVRRIAQRHVGDGPLTVGEVPEEERASAALLVQRDWRDGEFECAVRRALAQGLGLKEITAQTAEAAIRLVLDDEDGNVQRAALKLHVTDRALQMRRAAGRQREPEAEGVSQGEQTEALREVRPPGFLGRIKRP